MLDSLAFGLPLSDERNIMFVMEACIQPPQTKEKHIRWFEAFGAAIKQNLHVPLSLAYPKDRKSVV